MKKILLLSMAVAVLSVTFGAEAVWAGGKHHHHHHHHHHHNGNIVSESEQYIGREKATSIAYSHAGVSSSNMVRKYDIKLKDKGNGYIFYEIEFVYNKREYEYEVDAVTGEIIHWESERD